MVDRPGDDAQEPLRSARSDETVHDAGFEEFCRTAGRGLVRALQAKGHGEQDAADAVQEAMVKVYLGWAGLSAPWAYALKVAENWLVRTGMKDREQRERESAVEQGRVRDVLAHWQGEQHVMAVLGEVVKGTAQLRALTLHVVYDLKSGAIAEVLGEPVSRVRQNLYQAKRKFKTLSKEEQIEVRRKLLLHRESPVRREEGMP